MAIDGSRWFHTVQRFHSRGSTTSAYTRSAGALIVVLLVLMAGATSLPSFAWWRDSVTAKPLATFAAILRSKLPDELAKRFKFQPVAPTVAGTEFKKAAVAERMFPCVA